MKHITNGLVFKQKLFDGLLKVINVNMNTSIVTVERTATVTEHTPNGNPIKLTEEWNLNTLEIGFNTGELYEEQTEEQFNTNEQIGAINERKNEDFAKEFAGEYMETKPGYKKVDDDIAKGY